MTSRKEKEFLIRRMFPVIYRTVHETLDTCGTENFNLFVRLLVKKLKKNVDRVRPVPSLANCYSISGLVWLQILPETSDLEEAVAHLRNSLREDEEIRTGYILHLCNPPAWKQVQVSDKWRQMKEMNSNHQIGPQTKNE